MMNQHWTEAAVRAIGGFAAATLTTIFSLNAHAYTWDDWSNPANMDPGGKYEYNLSKLPLEGQLARVPWSETYWAMNKGSIDIRWNTPDQDGFNYTPPTREEVARMSQAELAQLSPAEKYDIYRGRYDYPLWWEVTGWRNPSAPDWFGICDGWSYAAIEYAEPKVVMVKNPDGIMVPFGSSDIKGLMSFAAVTSENKIRYFEQYQVGIRCARVGADGCTDDPNPGAVHVVLANQIGIMHEGFITERDPGPEVWNQPTYGFKFQMLGSAIPTAGEKGVLVHATLYYTDELEQSLWDPVVGTANFRSGKLEMDYVLDLDANGNIIGGTWSPGSDQPDYLWKPVNHLAFKGYLAGINELIKK